MSTRNDTLFPYTTRFRSRGFWVGVLDEQMVELAERDPSFHTGEETFAEWSRLYADVLWEADQASPLAKGDALLVLQDIMAGRTSRALARSAAARAAAASGAAGLAAEIGRAHV